VFDCCKHKILELDTVAAAKLAAKLEVRLAAMRKRRLAERKKGR
jgi:hypothetical protein